MKYVWKPILAVYQHLCRYLVWFWNRKRLKRSTSLIKQKNVLSNVIFISLAFPVFFLVRIKNH